MPAGETSVVGGVTSTGTIKGNGAPLSLGRAVVAYPSDANYTAVQSEYECDNIEIAAGVVTAGRNLVLPLVAGARKWIWNKTGQTITVIGPSGTGTAIATTKAAFVYCDGTNWVRASADVTP